MKKPETPSVPERHIYHKQPIALIESLRRGRKITLLNGKSPLHKNPARIRLNKDKLSIRIVATHAHPFSVPFGSIKHTFMANVRPKAFALKGIFLNSQRSKVSSGSIDKLHSKGFQPSRPYFYRLLIPLEKVLHFHYVLEERVYTTDLGYRSRTGTIITTQDESFTICVCHEGDRYYLSIESNQKQTHESFSDKTFSILCALAFLTGIFPGNVNFFFAYRNSKMETYDQFQMNETRKTIKSLYQPIYTNPYAVNGIAKRAQETWYNSKSLRPVFVNEFSLFYEKLAGSNELRIAILLLVQSMAASMEQLPGGISIALEMLPAIILGSLKIDLRPIKDKKLRNKIFAEIRKVLDDHQTELGKEAHKILVGKLDHFNQVTNQAKLRAPFEAIGITLSAEDLVALDSRNDFLHGRIPDILRLGANRPSFRKTRDAFYCGVRLYTLISMLILKSIGYDNYVLNQPVISKNICQVPLKEKPYRKVS